MSIYPKYKRWGQSGVNIPSSLNLSQQNAAKARNSYFNPANFSRVQKEREERERERKKEREREREKRERERGRKRVCKNEKDLQLCICVHHLNSTLKTALIYLSISLFIAFYLSIYNSFSPSLLSCFSTFILPLSQLINWLW